ncbi:MAG TPA: cellulase family glycosylhydrolase [Hymenobacter sp.]|jgi:endoglucanase|uniref:cellulase family glycosylhydrolase n=1 Tax=Hymenobacter sp. TaxID=1898978 RepID=UPI002ED922C3
MQKLFPLQGHSPSQTGPTNAQRRSSSIPGAAQSPAASSLAFSLLAKCGRGLALAFLLLFANVCVSQAQTIVERYGQLRVSGNRIVDKTGTAIQLRGMSLYWSQWVPKYYNYNTVKWLRDDWRVTVVRAAMAVDVGGYATNPAAEQAKVFTVIDAAISLGIYVIVDFHVHDAAAYRTQAQTFFRAVAQKYGASPNILYETWNEPLDVSWANVIKPYHQTLVSTIRQYDPDNIIILGTGFYSQRVDEAAANKVAGSNLAYTLHFYANTHNSGLRAAAQRALDNNAALFVTEYGTTDASGKGTVNEAETRNWYTFMDQNKISHANWSVADIPESSAALVSGASENGGWTTSQIKQSGLFVRSELRAKYPGTTTTPPATGTLANGRYRIVARHSGKVLGVAGGSTVDGADITQYTNSGATNQQWNVVSLGSGAYSIRAVHSGKAMDLSGSSTADGGDINQWTYSGGNNQRWRIESVGSGYYHIVSVASNKCVDVPGASTTDGVAINQWTCGTGSNQSFQFVALSAARTADTDQVDAGSNTSVYPNPSQSTFTVRELGAFTYSIIDGLGRVVDRGQGTNEVTVGQRLAAGLFVLRVQGANGVKTMRVSKK